MKPEDFLAKLRTLPEAIQKGAEACGPKALELIADGFRAGQDPYGNGWKQRKKTLDRPHQSGEFAGSFTQQALPMGFIVRSSHPAAKWQHEGTETIPARPVVPLKKRGLPEKWRRAFAEIMDNAVRGHMKG